MLKQHFILLVSNNTPAPDQELSLFLPGSNSTLASTPATSCSTFARTEDMFVPSLMDTLPTKGCNTEFLYFVFWL